MSTNSNDAAMPSGMYGQQTQAGMSKREYFAVMAMQGILSDPSNNDLAPKFIKDKLGLPEETVYEYPKHYMQYVSITSVAAADALIKALNADPTTHTNG